MKSRLFFALAAVVLVLAAIAAAGCSREAEGPEPPAVTGIINAVEDNVILVVEGIEKGGLPAEEWMESGYRAVNFTVTGDCIIERDGETVSPDQLVVGLKVEVWADGPLAESYPEQGKAKRIVILEDCGREVEEKTGGEEGATEDLQIDSGRFAGKTGDSIAVKISGVPDEIGPAVFRLSEEVLAGFDQYALETDDEIKFTYKIDEQGEKVIVELTRMNGQ